MDKYQYDFIFKVCHIINENLLIDPASEDYINGDVIYYTIKIEEKYKEKIVWEKTVKTNQVVLQGLEN